jgi:hypothetical protein
MTNNNNIKLKNLSRKYVYNSVDSNIVITELIIAVYISELIRAMNDICIPASLSFELSVAAT